MLLLFGSSEWNASVDYMFFRNFHPNVAQLSDKLQKSGTITPSLLASRCFDPPHNPLLPGINDAYCCQCKWQTAKGGRLDSSGAFAAWYKKKK
jgi:hypothetical protein